MNLQRKVLFRGKISQKRENEALGDRLFSKHGEIFRKFKICFRFDPQNYGGRLDQELLNNFSNQQLLARSTCKKCKVIAIGCYLLYVKKIRDQSKNCQTQTKHSCRPVMRTYILTFREVTVYAQLLHEISKSYCTVQCGVC